MDFVAIYPSLKTASKEHPEMKLAWAIAAVALVVAIPLDLLVSGIATLIAVLFALAGLALGLVILAKAQLDKWRAPDAFQRHAVFWVRAVACAFAAFMALVVWEAFTGHPCQVAAMLAVPHSQCRAEKALAADALTAPPKDFRGTGFDF